VIQVAWVVCLSLSFPPCAEKTKPQKFAFNFFRFLCSLSLPSHGATKHIHNIMYINPFPCLSSAHNVISVYTLSSSIWILTLSLSLCSSAYLYIVTTMVVVAVMGCRWGWRAKTENQNMVSRRLSRPDLVYKSTTSWVWTMERSRGEPSAQKANKIVVDINNNNNRTFTFSLSHLSLSLRKKSHLSQVLPKPFHFLLLPFYCLHLTTLNCWFFSLCCRIFSSSSSSSSSPPPPSNDVDNSWDHTTLTRPTFWF